MFLLLHHLLLHSLAEHGSEKPLGVYTYPAKKPQLQMDSLPGEARFADMQAAVLTQEGCCEAGTSDGRSGITFLSNTFANLQRSSDCYHLTQR